MRENTLLRIVTILFSILVISFIMPNVSLTDEIASYDVRFKFRLIDTKNKAEAEGILIRLENGEPFEKIANQKIMEIRWAELRTEFKRALEELKGGEYSKIFQVESNYMIAQILEKQKEIVWTNLNRNFVSQTKVDGVLWQYVFPSNGKMDGEPTLRGAPAGKGTMYYEIPDEPSKLWQRLGPPPPEYIRFNAPIYEVTIENNKTVIRERKGPLIDNSGAISKVTVKYNQVTFNDVYLKEGRLFVGGGKNGDKIIVSSLPPFSKVKVDEGALLLLTTGSSLYNPSSNAPPSLWNADMKILDNNTIEFSLGRGGYFEFEILTRDGRIVFLRSTCQDAGAHNNLIK
jgi:hypothetical protein